MIDNIIVILTALLIYVIFWTANTIASLVLNIIVIGDDWDKDKFIKSLWRLLGMGSAIILLAVGLSLASTDTITIDTLSNIIMVAAFTRLAEAITKVKDMFGYKNINDDTFDTSEPIPGLSDDGSNDGQGGSNNGPYWQYTV